MQYDIFRDGASTNGVLNHMNQTKDKEGVHGAGTRNDVDLESKGFRDYLQHNFDLRVKFPEDD